MLGHAHVIKEEMDHAAGRDCRVTPRSRLLGVASTAATFLRSSVFSPAAPVPPLGLLAGSARFRQGAGRPDKSSEPRPKSGKEHCTACRSGCSPVDSRSFRTASGPGQGKSRLGTARSKINAGRIAPRGGLWCAKFVHWPGNRPLENHELVQLAKWTRLVVGPRPSTRSGDKMARAPGHSPAPNSVTALPPQVLQRKRATCPQNCGVLGQPNSIDHQGPHLSLTTVGRGVANTWVLSFYGRDDNSYNDMR